MKKKITKLLLTVTISLFAMGAMAQTYYVNATQATSGNGLSWGAAFKTLQEALNVASSGTQIWVATGTYQPSVMLTGGTGPRDNTFVLKEGVAIYGGFPASGTPGMGDRNFTANETILSGDFNGDDAVSLNGDEAITSITGNGENAYHVVVSYDNSPTTILDGFTISGGNANGANTISPTLDYPFSQAAGGGLFLRKSSPTLNNLVVKNNHASADVFAGAGIYIGGTKQNVSDADEIHLSNTEITQNWASGNIGTNNLTQKGGGAGMYVAGYSYTYFCKVNLSNVSFNGNNSTGGGALRVFTFAEVAATNTTFSKNIAATGAAIAFYGTVTDNSRIVLEDCTLSENKTTSSGGAIYAGTNSQLDAKNNTAFIKNESGASAGAIYITSATAYITVNRVHFIENKATGGTAGAIYITGNSANNSIANSVFFKNEGSGTSGGLTFENGQGTIINSTFYGNRGTTGANGAGAIRLTGSANNVVNVYNSIFYDNTGLLADINAGANAVLIIANTITQVYPTGTNLKIDVGPLFLNTTDPNDAGFLRLSPDGENPAIDAGDNSKYDEFIYGDKDLTNVNDRKFNSGLKPVATIDMGAYENITTPLPVELSSPLSAKANGNTVVITWATASETNNSHFILERSANGASFAAITSVASKGNGAKYSHTDFSPTNGVNYYRLVQIDNDGKQTTYTPVSVNISLNTKNGASIYPNPVAGTEVNVNLGNAAAGIYGYKMVSTTGSVAQQGALSYNGSSAVVSIASLPAGVYVIQFSNGAQAKLIKQ